VQPGTLGVEAMLQLLQLLLLHTGLGDGIAGARFEPVALGHELAWRYRGQVVPENGTVEVDLELMSIEREAGGLLATAEASLWVDGLPIYHARGLGMRIVEDPAAAAARPIDTDGLRVHWRTALALDRGSLSEDVHLALVDKYVRRVIVEDQRALDDIRGRSTLFLANHQVAIETSLFMILASYMTGAEIHAIAKAEHRASWLGDLLDRTLSYPGMRPMRNVIYLDRQDHAAAARTLEDLKRTFFDGARSLLVHVDGTRSLSCRTPVTRVSAVFLDMAVDLDVPVVPVRFAGGLPAVSLAERLEFPLDHGTQDYYIGRPIPPEALRRLPYAARGALVLEAISALGPSPAQEAPNPGDTAFAAAVEMWHETTGAAREHAALLTALQRLRNPCADTAALLAGVSGGSLAVADDERGRWIGAFARLLYGPHGPRVREGA
jgi:1-acyl-sn-glycerol-3-phosphate acyltransferase